MHQTRKLDDGRFVSKLLNPIGMREFKREKKELGVEKIVFEP